MMSSKHDIICRKNASLNSVFTSEPANRSPIVSVEQSTLICHHVVCYIHDK